MLHHLLRKPPGTLRPQPAPHPAALVRRMCECICRCITAHRRKWGRWGVACCGTTARRQFVQWLRASVSLTGDGWACLRNGVEIISTFGCAAQTTQPRAPGGACSARGNPFYSRAERTDPEGKKVVVIIDPLIPVGHAKPITPGPPRVHRVCPADHRAPFAVLSIRCQPTDLTVTSTSQW